MMYAMRRSMVALGLVLCAGMETALAQTASPTPTVTDPNLIRSCLCEQQAVTTLQDTLISRRQAMDGAQSNAASLSNQVATRRAAINVYNPNEIDAFKRLLEQRDAAVNATFAATQSYDSAAISYNDAVDAYNTRCAGRGYDQTVLRQVTATLACPRLQPPPQ